MLLFQSSIPHPTECIAEPNDELHSRVAFAVHQILIVVMPGKLKVKVVAGRNLPVMDRSSELTDAFVEVVRMHCQKSLFYCSLFF